ncbi:MAG: hypothetical protein U5J83_09850 [Bryobacterales bacterium]|nr:hypothetical protein [Bryobacterales bacterium]
MVAILGDAVLPFAIEGVVERATARKATAALAIPTLP